MTVVGILDVYSSVFLNDLKSVGMLNLNGDNTNFRSISCLQMFQVYILGQWCKASYY
jgi:hypothetical protein